ncbi:MAG: trigger factor [Actinomycetota bacterium]|nr:trigger factor [Actinomycetota bacterium]
MKVEVERGEKNKVILKVEVPKEDVAKGMVAAYAKISKKVNVPGFRKGKVPKKVIDSHFGEGLVIDEMIKEVVPGSYERAVAESNVEPIDLPKIDVKEAGADHLVYQAEVEVKPEVILGDYKKISVKKAEVKVTDDEVKAQIESARNRKATLSVADDRLVREGDFVMIDFEGLLDGKEFEGGSGIDSMIEIGGQMLLPGFDKNLIGAGVGDELSFSIDATADFDAVEIAGKKVDFKVIVKEIKVKNLPEPNDEFADMAAGCKDMAEYKADIKKKLTDIKAAKAEEDFHREILIKLAEESKVDIPAIMVDRRVDDMVSQFMVGMKSRGVGSDEYFKATGSSPDILKESFKERAAGTVKESLVLEALAKKEKIEVSFEEVDKEIGELADGIGEEKEDLKKTLQERGVISDIEDDLLMRKAMERLVEMVKAKADKKDNKEEETGK